MAEHSRALDKNGTWRGGLFPLGFGDLGALSAWLDQLQAALASGTTLRQLAHECLGAYHARVDCPHTVVLLAHGREELLREAAHCRRTLPAALERGEAWRTPGGSYGTPRPLGREGVAFVYPGMGSVYAGFARCWPFWSPSVAAAVAKHFGPAALDQALARLAPDGVNGDGVPQTLLELPGELVRVGVTLAYAQTALLRRVLGLRPRWALGYSMGETAMYGCLGFFHAPGPALGRLSDSELWRTEIAGPMNLVRRQWGLAPAQAGERPPWESQAFALARGEVEPLLARESRVFLTHINAPREVVLSGEPAALRRLADRLPCAGPAWPLALALHCPVTRAAHAKLRELATEEGRPCSDLTFYSSAYNAAVPQQARAVAQAVAECFCRPVDFPALVHAAYAAGARVFVEVGPRRICSSWVEAIMAGRPHAAIPLDNKGAGDAASWERALAQLLAHRVELDLSALPLPDESAGVLTARVVGDPPGGRACELRTWLGQQLQEALGLAVPPDPEASFLELGVDSLGAVALAIRLTARLNLAEPLPTTVVFDHPNIAALAAFLAPRSAAAQPRPASPPAGLLEEAAPEFPLSWQQLPIWRMQQRADGFGLYNLSVVLRLRGSLDRVALEKTLRRLLVRHPALRLMVRETDAGPVQWFAPTPQWALAREVCSGVAPEQRSAFLEERSVELARVPFDHDRELPVRATLLTFAPEEHALVLVIHHLASDGVSFKLLLRDFFALYPGDEGKPDDPLPSPSSSYADFVYWQRRQLTPDRLGSLIRHWQTVLGRRIPPIALPYDHKRPHVPAYRGGHSPFHIPAPLLQALRSRCQTEQATLFIGLLSALALAVQRQSGSHDFCLGAFFANRNQEQFFDVVGCFINQLPLRMDLRGIRTQRELLQHARSVMRVAQEHSELPLALLSDHLEVAPLHPTLQVAIVFHSEMGNLANLPSRLGPELEVEVVPGHNRVAKRDCTFHIWAAGESLSGVLVYDAALFEAATARSMVDGYLRALGDLGNNTATLCQGKVNS